MNAYCCGAWINPPLHRDTHACKLSVSGNSDIYQPATAQRHTHMYADAYASRLPVPHAKARIDTDTHRHTQTHRRTDRHTHTRTHTDTQTDTQTHTHIHIPVLPEQGHNLEWVSFAVTQHLLDAVVNDDERACAG